MKILALAIHPRNLKISIGSKDLWWEYGWRGNREDEDRAIASLPGADGALFVYDDFPLFGSRVRRSAENSIPLIGLTQSIAPATRIEMIRSGVDLALTMPVERDEVMEYFKVFSQKTRRTSSMLLNLGNAEVDLYGQSLKVSGTNVPLTSKEMSMFCALAGKAENVVSKTELMQHIYGASSHTVGGKTLEVFMCKIRKKLRDSGASVRIDTYYGRGWVLREVGSEEHVSGNRPDTEKIVAIGRF